MIKTLFCCTSLLLSNMAVSLSADVSDQDFGTLFKESSIKIYEVDLVLEDAPNSFGRADFDFNVFDIKYEHDKIRCGFGIHRAIYETGVIEEWSLVNGDLLIENGLVKFLNHRWRTRGLSNSSYLTNEANLKLTKEGYIVGKMPYFHLFIDAGEPPMLPLYVSFKKHKKSKPIDINSSVGVSAEMWVEVDGWADGVMYLRCNKV